MTPEELAQLIQETYQTLAPDFDLDADNWEEIVQENGPQYQLSVAVAKRVLAVVKGRAEAGTL